MTSDPADPGAARTRALLERATVALTEAAGDRSLCAISRSGAPVSAVKYHEGRAAALSMVLRLLKDSDLTRASAAARQRFESGPRDGGDWDAYRQGAIDALEEAMQPVG